MKPIGVAIGAALVTLAGCETPTSESGAAAQALIAETQQRFALEQHDFRGRMDPAVQQPRASRRMPILAPQPTAELVVAGGRIRRAEPARLAASSGLRASERIALVEPSSGVAVSVALQDATDAPAELASGYVVYRGGYRAGADVIHQVGLDRHEDFVLFAQPPSESVVRYQLELGDQVAGLRLVENILELLDRDGIPQLRMNRPYAVDATGRRHLATVAVEGCAYDQSPQAPFYRDVTAPGASACSVAVAWDGSVGAYPLVLDPVWTTTGSMTSPREGHGMALLTTGDVLAAGGSDGNDILATAEVYSVSAGAWAATASLPDGGRYGAQVLSPGANISTLGDPVYLGGFRGLDTITNITAVERYNVGSGTWSTLTPSLTGRNGHAAALYATSSGAVRMMVTGGYNTASAILASGELGTGTGAWTSTTYGGSSFKRTNHTLTRLNNGRLLMTGGYGGSQSNSFLASGRIFNPSNGNWNGGGNLGTGRKDHTATLLNDGRVLLAGGIGSGFVALTSAEVSDATGGSFTTLTSTLSVARGGHTATKLGDGTVVLVGGMDSAGNVLNSAERFDPTTNTFSLFGTPGSSARLFQDTTLLNDGRALLCGGLTTLTSGTPTASCEFFDITAD